MQMIVITKEFHCEKIKFPQPQVMDSLPQPTLGRTDGLLLGHHYRVLILCLAVDVVDVVNAILWVIDPLPTKRQLILPALLCTALLYPS